MDGVPLVFVESVIRNSDIDASEKLQQLSSAWGQVGEVQKKNVGQLFLSFVPHYKDGHKEWHLHYAMKGFDHIKTRTLSPEVVKEMSKSITSIDFEETWSVDLAWHSVSPDDVDLLQLITILDAPVKELDINEATDYHGISLFVELRSKYVNLLRSFTSLRLTYFEDTRLMEDTIFAPRVRSVNVDPDWECWKGTGPISFWVDFFFSEQCTRLKLDDLDVALGLIKHWQKMDPRPLKYSKLLHGIYGSLEDLKDIKMREINLKETKTPLTVRQQNHIESLHCIDHPVDPSSKIYVLVYRDWRNHGVDLLFE
uniref:FBA_2 domain-containing protein n=1 Tax=Steinernema glaseri TaxID=37863 RepID=A0A1I7Z8T1_9BILA